jgi:hypothetical protein
MTLVIATKKNPDFDPKQFLSTLGHGRRIVPFPKSQAIYAHCSLIRPLGIPVRVNARNPWVFVGLWHALGHSQGAGCDAVFYIQKGKVT